MSNAPAPAPADITSGINTSPNKKPRDISFGSTTSSNATNTINYTKKHEMNNKSQTRQNKSTSYRPIKNHPVPRHSFLQSLFPWTRDPNITHAQELHNARISKNSTSPTRGSNPGYLSPTLAPIYAKISANSKNIPTMRRAINEYTSLSPQEKKSLHDRINYEYESNSNLNNKSSRKTRKQSHRSRR